MEEEEADSQSISTKDVDDLSRNAESKNGFEIASSGIK